jgi:hypothetical protein
MSQKRPTQQGESRDTVSGLGDDQGTRVGAPDQTGGGAGTARAHSESESPRPERQTGVGSEASEGMHDSQQGGGRDETDTTGLSGQDTGRSARDGGKRAGSEPLAEDGDQHRSGYGGAGGSPVNSSDTREPTRKR